MHRAFTDEEEEEEAEGGAKFRYSRGVISSENGAPSKPVRSKALLYYAQFSQRQHHQDAYNQDNMCSPMVKDHRHMHVHSIRARVEGFTPPGDVLPSSASADVKSTAGFWQIFDRPARQTGASWENLICRYSKWGKHHLVLTMYQRQPKDNLMQLNGHTAVCLLKACAKCNDSEVGSEIHDYAARSGLLERDIYVGSSVVDMYVKCGSIVKAENVLNKLPVRNVVSWTTLIAGYVDYGKSEKALKCLQQMESEGVPPNALTFVYCLRACCGLRDPTKNEEVHADIERHGLFENVFVGTTLVDMYAKCGSLVKAQQVFERLSVRNVVSWTALIGGYAEHGHGNTAINCYERMLLEGVAPNAVTYVSCLKACGVARDISAGQELHANIKKEGMLEQDIMIGVTLVDMYAKCGCLGKAQQVFDMVRGRNVVLWNALIAGYAELGHGERALTCFEQMQGGGVLPDEVTFLCALKACASIKALAKGQEIHFELERRGLVEENLAIANTLVDMYAKCGLLTIAELVFNKLSTRNVVSWNALIAGYSEHGSGEKVMDLFERMQHENIFPDSVSYLCGLKACATEGAMDMGRGILSRLIRQSPCERDVYVGSTLVNVYAKRGSLAKAKEVFDELPVRDEVSWNALIAGYAEHGHGEDVLKYLDQMQLEGFLPNAVSFLCSLKACSSIGAIDKGRDFHAEIERRGMMDKELVGNALVDMYAKCGALAMAQQVFESLTIRDVVAWTALMAGYGQLGKCDHVFYVFDRMVGAGVMPNPVTLVVVLSACNRTCLFIESRSYFERMSEDYGVVPTIKHHACMVDVFSRAGHMDYAISMLREMPYSANLAVWHIILGACKGYGNAELGNQAFGFALLEDEPDSPSSIEMS